MKARLLIALTAPALMASAVSSPNADGFKASYLYNLASTDAVFREPPDGISYDPTADELFVTRSGVVTIFNKTGMEVFRFTSGAELGAVAGVIALEEGDLVVLSAGKDWKLLRCSFRGEPQGAIALTGAPAEFLEGFYPATLKYAAGHLYVADKQRMKILVARPTGEVVATHDLTKVEGFDEDKRQEAAIHGLDVDPRGNILFTVPVLFRAFVLSPDGKARSFGAKGSTPGKFNVVGGITGDAQGNVYVTDMLRSVVMAFDGEFRFLREWGYRGARPSSLVAPHDLVAGNGKLFVSQMGARGVSVFRVAAN